MTRSTTRPSTSLETTVHVWLANLDAIWAMHGLGLAASLSGDELKQADEFRLERDSQRFVARRAILRMIVGDAAGCSAAEVAFRYGIWGKPSLASDVGARAPITFSSTHSAGLAAVAVSRGGPVGVDVERTRADLDVVKLAADYFAPTEVEGLLATPSNERHRIFLAAWTRKEAYVKAIGMGLSYPLDAFAVNPLTARPSRVCSTEIPPRPLRWTVHPLSLGRRYAGAVVVRGHRRVLISRIVDPDLWIRARPR